MSDLSQRIQNSKFDDLFDACRAEIENSLRTDKWLEIFPGKELLKGLCSIFGLGKPPVLQNSIIKEMASKPSAVTEEIVSFVQSVLRRCGRDRLGVR